MVKYLILVFFTIHKIIYQFQFFCIQSFVEFKFFEKIYFRNVKNIKQDGLNDQQYKEQKLTVPTIQA